MMSSSKLFIVIAILSKLMLYWAVRAKVSIYLEDDILRFDLTQCPSQTCLLNQQDAKDIVKILKKLGYIQFSNSKNSISESVYVQQKPDGLYQWHFSHQDILETDVTQNAYF